jgi:hypothetical protein
MNIEGTKKALEITSAIFKNHDIHYWLEAGTLLGAIRDKCFIPWGSDADLGVWYQSMSKIFDCMKDFDGKSCEMYYTHGHFSIRDHKTKEHLICLLPSTLHRGHYQWVLFYPPLTWLIFILSSQDMAYDDESFKNIKLPKQIVSLGRYLTSSLTPPMKNFLLKSLIRTQTSLRLFKRRNVSKSEFFPYFVSCTLYNVSHPVPSRYPDYLHDFYGSDWRTPKLSTGEIVTSWKGEI